MYAEQPFRRLKPFAFRKPLLKDCSSPGERLVLAPGGLMGFCDSCYPTGEHFYPIEDFPGYDSVEYETWVKLSSPEMPDCRECPAMTVCGGACRYDAYRASGRWDGVDPERCKFERAFLNHLIWDLFDKTGIHSEPVFVPQDADRAVLFGNVSLKEENQPFIAGSYL
ncbi:MAG: SPASM domain-containing protein [FCB group bacterium]|nr:SPASM domain-containing protein [FCB group bacterium]